jgi:hypothetical protein
MAKTVSFISVSTLAIVVELTGATQVHEQPVAVAADEGVCEVLALLFSRHGRRG